MVKENLNLIKRGTLNNFSHLQIPRKIWNLFLEKKIDPSTFKIYVELFDRIKISATNNWFDENENIYIKYSYEELKKLLRAKSNGTISSSLKLLKDLNLIIQIKGFNTSSIFYLVNILDNTTKKSTSVLQNFSEQSSKKLEPNNNYFNNNNSNKIMEQATYNFFEKIFKEFSVNFTIRNQKSIIKLLKTQNLEEVKNYLLDTFAKINSNSKIKNPSGVFSKIIESGKKEISPSSKVIQTKIYLKNQNLTMNILDKEKKEQDILDNYFSKLSSNDQNNLLLKAFKLAKKEMENAPYKIIEITSKKVHKYILLKELYSNKFDDRIYK